MKKNILQLFFVFYLINVAHSQKLQQFTDSIIYNINNNNYEKAKYFSELAEDIIDENVTIKDTLFADYLYAKGVLNIRLGNFSPSVFDESISIWNTSTNKNYLKIIKNYYFLAAAYIESKDYTNGYNNYEKLYLLNKEFDIGNNTYFLNSIYSLSVIDYTENFNFKSAEMYADEYIDLNKDVAYLNFDFNYAYAFRWKEDSKGYEDVLLLFKKKYETENLNNPRLYLQINYLLFEHYSRQYYYYKNPTFKNIILYGEKFIESCEDFNMKNEYDKALQSIYSGLAMSYYYINDHLNQSKYKKLIKE